MWKCSRTCSQYTASVTPSSRGKRFRKLKRKSAGPIMSTLHTPGRMVGPDPRLIHLREAYRRGRNLFQYRTLALVRRKRSR